MSKAGASILKHSLVRIRDQLRLLRPLVLKLSQTQEKPDLIDGYDAFLMLVDELLEITKDEASGFNPLGARVIWPKPEKDN